MCNTLSSKKLEETIDTWVISILNYMTWMDNSHLSTVDLVLFMKDSVLEICKNRITKD